MADYMNIKISGADELKKTIAQLPQVLADKVYLQALRSGANLMRDAAKESAPVAAEYNIKHAYLKKSRKGDRTLLIKLKDEIRVSVVTKTPITYEMAVHVGRAFWGMFLEFGTSKMHSRPWMRPAFENTKTKALDLIGSELGSNVEKQAAKLAGNLSKSGLLRRF